MAVVSALRLQPGSGAGVGATCMPGGFHPCPSLAHRRRHSSAHQSHGSVAGDLDQPVTEPSDHWLNRTAHTSPARQMQPIANARTRALTVRLKAQKTRREALGSNKEVCRGRQTYDSLQWLEPHCVGVAEHDIPSVLNSSNEERLNTLVAPMSLNLAPFKRSSPSIAFKLTAPNLIRPSD
eukprot:SM000078S22052  [mRNA]  locus=s78:122279:127128:- [translate_table: standard]